ncbi:hypothetical protein GCM10025751_45230 [Haladaptatus pallidirubidus]|uniref:Transposase n=1 Tax=Haladaptatus pallidirubidus TaxID=1008152 RepID=A0AAV3UNG9_9EURY
MGSVHLCADVTNRERIYDMKMGENAVHATVEEYTTIFSELIEEITHLS